MNDGLNIKDTLLIELHFFPSIDYFSKIIAFEKLMIEAKEHYGKGSYRNRAHIATANGMASLTVPLQKGKNEQMPVREVKISYEYDWQRNMHKNLQTAYGRSPFYEHYIDALAVFFTKHYTFLYDYNFEILIFFMELLKINTFTEESKEYVLQPSGNVADMRNTIMPKNRPEGNENTFKANRYAQVFEDRLGFIPGLSILDLLFCAGPEAKRKLI